MTPPTGLKLRRSKAPTPPLSDPADNDIPRFTCPPLGAMKQTVGPPVYDFEVPSGETGTTGTTTFPLLGEQEPSEDLLLEILEDGGEEIEITITATTTTTTILEELIVPPPEGFLNSTFVARDEADVAETLMDFIVYAVLGGGRAIMLFFRGPPLLRTRSVHQYLSLLAITVGTFFCSCSWLAYGLYMNDIYVLVPNGIGAFLCVFQLLVIFWHFWRNKDEYRQ